MCFSLGAVEHLLIWIAVIVAVFAIIRVLLGLVPQPPEFAWVINATVQIVKIVLWLVIAIAIIVVLFALLSCVVPFPALH